MSRDSRPRQYGDAAKLDDRDRISGDRRERDSRSHRRDDYSNTSSRHDRSRSPERHRDDDSHSYRRPRADDGRRDRRDSPPRGSGRSFRGSRDDDRKRQGEDGYGQSSSTKLPPRANSLPDPKTKPIMMKLGSVGAPAATKPFSLGATSSSQPLPPKSKPAVAKVFGNDSDSEEEEMPPEAKMRMKNVGRFTPTSAGPNSFGKTKAGFVDSNTLFQRKLDEEAKKLAGK